MKKPKVILIVAAVLLVTAALAGRIIAHKAAGDYGRNFRQAFQVIGYSGFADTAKLREFFASPEMSIPRKRMESLSFLGGDFCTIADELQLGAIYLSEQMSLEPPQRSSPPPAFRRLSLRPSDGSPSGLTGAVGSLITSYESQL